MMRRVVCVLTALLTAGCGRYEPLSLHGAGSMRVEVEVYKGPLSVPIPGQVGEIVGVLSDSIRAMNDWEIKARRVEARVCGSQSILAAQVREGETAQITADQIASTRLAIASAAGRSAADANPVAVRAQADAMLAKRAAAAANARKIAADELATAKAAAAESAAAAARPLAARTQAEAEADRLVAERARVEAAAARLAAVKAWTDQVAADQVANAKADDAAAAARAAAAADPVAVTTQSEANAARLVAGDAAVRLATNKHLREKAGENQKKFALARNGEPEAPTAQAWGNCQALRNALASSGDIISAACYMIRTPTLIKIVGRAVYMPMGTCDARDAFDLPSTSIEARIASDAQRYPMKEGGERAPTYKQEYRKQLIEGIDKCIELVATRTDKSDSEMVAQLKCEGDVIGIALDNLSTVMRTAAFRSVDGNFRQIPTDDEVRGLLVEFGYTASEYGNHLQARVTVLQKQMNTPVGVIAARTLPVSDYLRDSGRTDFIQLYDWLDGASDSHGVTQAGYATNKRPGDLDLQERIRMAQRLTADAYWQKVNEVYASGQGDVAMAFIKDDLGNWDLKSFSNDPSALLASYRKVTDAALKTTIELTRKAALGPAGETAARITSAQRMAGVANQFATGEAPGQAATVAGANLVTLHDRAAARMAAQRTRFESQERKLTSDIATHDAASKKAVADQAALDQDVADKTAALAAADDAGKPAAQLALAKAELLRDEKREPHAKAKMEADVALKSAEERLAALPGEAIEAVRATLDDHLAVVAAMQEGIAAKAPAPAPQE